MFALPLFASLAIVGHLLNQQEEKKRKANASPREMFLNPEGLLDGNTTEELITQNSGKGHGNMVPFFGSKLTQPLSGEAHKNRLDQYTGAGEHHMQKREEKSFFDIVPGATNSPYGQANESDFFQSRQVSSMRLNNVFPVEKILVGPGVDDGYTNNPSGGYNQERARDITMPKTTDELRTSNNPKVSYTSDPVPGSFFVTQPGLQAPVMKNRPDTFGILTDEEGNLKYANTSVGAQVAPAAFPEQVLKTQQRETTNKEYFGEAQNAQGGGLSYIRSFTEPFEQFMKLTVGEYFGSGGASVAATYVVDAYNNAYTNPNREQISSTEWYPGGSLPNGANPSGGSLNVDQKKQIESQLENAARLGVGSMNLGSSTEQMGVVRRDGAVSFDESAVRNNPDILDAFRSNPYTQSLTSVA